MHKKMWAYLIHLSTNMWGDEGGTSRYTPLYPELITDYGVWREVIDFLPAQGINTLVIDVGDAIQYETHPEISVKGAWSKDKMKAELDYIRSIGLTPIPKLNFASSHDAWLKEYERMLSTPVYYKVCEDLIKEVAELFDYPEYFHLGLDEETADHQKNLAFSCCRQKDLWWHDAYFFFDICEKLGMRPWIWADCIWYHQDVFAEKMPKSVLQSNWSYHPIRRYKDGTYKDIYYQSYVTLEEMGYDQVPTSSRYDRWYNSLETMELSKEHIAPERLVGHMTAPWHFTTANDRFTLLDDAFRFGNAKKEVYPEY